MDLFYYFNEKSNRIDHFGEISSPHLLLVLEFTRIALTSHKQDAGGYKFACWFFTIGAFLREFIKSN